MFDNETWNCRCSLKVTTDLNEQANEWANLGNNVFPTVIIPSSGFPVVRRIKIFAERGENAWSLNFNLESSISPSLASIARFPPSFPLPDFQPFSRAEFRVTWHLTFWNASFRTEKLGEEFFLRRGIERDFKKTSDGKRRGKRERRELVHWLNSGFLSEWNQRGPKLDGWMTTWIE